MSKEKESNKEEIWVPKDRDVYSKLDIYRAEEEAIDYLVQTALKPWRGKWKS